MWVVGAETRTPKQERGKGNGERQLEPEVLGHADRSQKAFLNRVVKPRLSMKTKFASARGSADTCPLSEEAIDSKRGRTYWRHCVHNYKQAQGAVD